MRIKDISKENRPLERLEKQGPAVLSDAELLAVILKTGTREENVIDMSNRLISKFGLDKLASCSLKELQNIKGIGKVKASQIVALFEFNKRQLNSKVKGNPIKNAKDVFDYCSPLMSSLDREQFVVLHLNTKGQIIRYDKISVGTLNTSIVHPREVFKSAIKDNSNSIILVHNHPSGDPTPSEEDLEITKRLIDAGNLLGIKVLDHIIIGKERWWSWMENLGK